MNEYRVTWEIDLDADDHEDAARRALELVSNPESIAHAFEVQQRTPVERTPLLIDLDEIDGRSTG